MAERGLRVYIDQMARKPERKPDDPEQYKRFLEAAEKAEADKTEAGADRAFKKVARPQGTANPSRRDRNRSQ